MKIKQIKIEDIKSYKYNAKKHSKKQIEQIAKSIERFGFNQPVVLDKNNVIIVGHGRVESAKTAGIDRVPAVFVDGLTKKEVNAYRLADNKLNESDWDMNLVFDEMNEIEDVILQELTGFDIDSLKKEEDEDPEVEFTEELLEENNYIVLKFNNEIDWLNALSNFDIKKVKALDSKKGFTKVGRGRVIDGVEALNAIL